MKNGLEGNRGPLLVEIYIGVHGSRSMTTIINNEYHLIMGILQAVF